MQVYEHRFPPMEAGRREMKWHFSRDSLRAEIGSRELRIRPSRIRVLCDAEPPDRDVAMISKVLHASERYDVYRREEWERTYPGQKPDVLIQTWHPEHGSNITGMFRRYFFIATEEILIQK
ncbi:MAG: hypothetical protein U5N26_10530 [Candidatus Marinimicrobia bacterium]|nr:hypothetical protein [Candidatus Neomarinimicrobiota bacterium]